MKYQDCLEECIGIKAFNEYISIFCGYPIPKSKVWQQCVAEATFELGDDAHCVNFMARYEVRLARRGIETVSAIRTERAIDEALFFNDIPAEILKAMVKRVKPATPHKNIKFLSYGW